MKVRELIDELHKQDPNADVAMVYDGSAREDISFVYTSNSGIVCLADWEAVVYDDNWRPKGSPSSVEEKYWYTPDNPNPKNNSEDD